jgi:HEAT repeat protein
VEQLARWLEAINRPARDAEGSPGRAVSEMRAAGVDNVFPLLCERLAAADPEARCDAITALLLLDAPRAAEPVLAMLSDPEITVRWHACGCLHDLGDERAVPALVDVLRSDPDPQVRGTAASALGGIGSPAAIPALLAAMESDHELDMHGFSPSRCAAGALDDILGTEETRIRLGGGLCRMSGREPDLGLLRRMAEALYEGWSSQRA